MFILDFSCLFNITFPYCASVFQYLRLLLLIIAEENPCGRDICTFIVVLAFSVTNVGFVAGNRDVLDIYQS